MGKESIVDRVKRSKHACNIVGMQEAIEGEDEKRVVDLLKSAHEAAKRCMIAPATGTPVAVQGAAAKRILTV